MKVVYIAGPYRAPNAWLIEQNIRRAEELALSVWKSGLVAICPHAITRFFQGTAPDDLWLNGCLELIKRSDAVLVVPDWEDSAGTLTEINFALKQRIPIYYSLNDLLFWHNGVQIIHDPRHIDDPSVIYE